MSLFTKQKLKKLTVLENELMVTSRGEIGMWGLICTQVSSVQSVASDSLQPHDMLGLPVHHQLLESTQTHVH